MAFEARSDPHSRTFAELAFICVPSLSGLVLEPRSRVKLTPVETDQKSGPRGACPALCGARR